MCYISMNNMGRPTDKPIGWADVDEECQNRMLDYIENNDIECVKFKFQLGPIKEVGKNGVQYDALIITAKAIIEKLNKKFPCRENAFAITKLDEAIMWLEKRTKDREARGVEGYSKA